jgi:hypothetical protein
MTDYEQKVLITREDLDHLRQLMREISGDLAAVRGMLATFHEARPDPLPPLEIPTPQGKRDLK